MDTDGYKLHKFKDALQDELDYLNSNEQVNFVEDKHGNLHEKIASNTNARWNGEQKEKDKDKKDDHLYWNAYLPGMVRFLKLKLNSSNPLEPLGIRSECKPANSPLQQTFSLNNVSSEEIRKVLENPGGKRKNQKRTMVAMTR